MSEFFAFLQLGYQHITDLGGYDHILFIIALCAIYNPQNWKKILILVTFFTIGHSITLALAALNVIQFSSAFIEFLIPITILVTCFTNFAHKMPKNIFDKEQSLWTRYLITTVFGLIHGMGFSNYLRSLLGKSSNIVPQLLAFNIGLELGQIIIVILFMILTFITVSLFKVHKRTWNLIVSGFVAGMTFTLLLEKWYF
ncbi:HupE/UreJ family protein [Emticicia sp. CRIBPO]|uniref:HupE/UreJ family protein n=1 Tax=Emticicia sp. CRIBPO TaxID=2683258 RepID=UPI001412A891|nr:HupE/UreJ family protein [Emticicia sp. CRIBPO]NBA86311.1 HupE/UreJ family protein [Emticicia sp. CRIBPO]